MLALTRVSWSYLHILASAGEPPSSDGGGEAGATCTACTAVGAWPCGSQLVARPAFPQRQSSPCHIRHPIQASRPASASRRLRTSSSIGLADDEEVPQPGELLLELADQTDGEGAADADEDGDEGLLAGAVDVESEVCGEGDEVSGGHCGAEFDEVGNVRGHGAFPFYLSLT